MRPSRTLGSNASTKLAGSTSAFSSNHPRALFLPDVHSFFFIRPSSLRTQAPLPTHNESLPSTQPPCPPCMRMQNSPPPLSVNSLPILHHPPRRRSAIRSRRPIHWHIRLPQTPPQPQSRRPITEPRRTRNGKSNAQNEIFRLWRRALCGYDGAYDLFG